VHGFLDAFHCPMSGGAWNFRRVSLPLIMEFGTGVRELLNTETRWIRAVLA
jgi:hypothetical protein